MKGYAVVEKFLLILIGVVALLGLFACIAAWYYRGTDAPPVLMGALVTIITLIFNYLTKVKKPEKEGKDDS
jgi:energy-converting hydrogenase Eha subunit C